jgi:hypothetical protein
MKQKILLGILSSDTYNEKEAFLAQMERNGFSIYSISSKIEEMARYLLKLKIPSEISEKDIDDIRRKGYVVNKLYWINLLLTSISEKENYILLNDLWQEDLYEGYVLPVVSDPILIPNGDCIRFPEKISDVEMKRWIKEIHEKMYNTK